MAGKRGKGRLAAKLTAANKDKDKKKPVTRSSSAGLQGNPNERKAHMLGASSSRESAIQEVDMMADWSKLLPEILELISDSLPLLDFIAFRSVCHNWRSSPSGRSEIIKFSKNQPWLMFYGIQDNSNKSGACYLYSHSHSGCCTVYLPALQGATVMESKFGWLIAHRGEHFFLINFFTYEKISLPDHVIASNQACTFTTFPTNKDCTVFIVTISRDSVIELSSCRIHADEAWAVKTLDIGKDVVGAMIGAFCCSCSYDHSHCECRLKDRIAIFWEENYSFYDYVKEQFKHGERMGSGKVEAWFEDARKANGRDWLARFGEKGISIAVCARSVLNGPSFGWARGIRVHTASGEPEPNVELNDVKAVAIYSHLRWTLPASLQRLNLSCRENDGR